MWDRGAEGHGSGASVRHSAQCCGICQSADGWTISRETPGANYELVMVRWGLIPRWFKEAKTEYSTINARAETVAAKPAFREAQANGVLRPINDRMPVGEQPARRRSLAARSGRNRLSVGVLSDCG